MTNLFPGNHGLNKHYRDVQREWMKKRIANGWTEDETRIYFYEQVTKPTLDNIFGDFDG